MAVDSGVLSDHEIEALLGADAIRTDLPLDEGQVQPASLDLRLAEDAYRLRASFLPGKDRTVAEMLQEPGIHMHRIDLTKEGAVLETGCVYLVPLMESLRLPAGIAARANFPIMVRPGDRLAQIRFKRKKPETLKEKVVSIDLESTGDQPVGYRAKHHSGIVDLRGIGAHEASQFWEPIWPRDGRIVLNPEEFYILVSREAVKVGAMEAAEMAPIAPELGEFRAHYAGFFDPGFGTNSGGSRAVLEVRSRDVPFILEHGQPVAKLVYESMASKPKGLYGGKGSNYQGQGLKLSKHFKT